MHSINIFAVDKSVVSGSVASIVQELDPINQSWHRELQPRRCLPESRDKDAAVRETVSWEQFIDRNHTSREIEDFEREQQPPHCQHCD